MSKMKSLIIHCEHVATDIRLRIPEQKIFCIQCGLIQVDLTPYQAARVRLHCSCMHSRLEGNTRDGRGRTTITVDPSQLDLCGEAISVWNVG